jgi:hypothetical protein
MNFEVEFSWSVLCAAFFCVNWLCVSAADMRSQAKSEFPEVPTEGVELKTHSQKQGNCSARTWTTGISLATFDAAY